MTPLETVCLAVEDARRQLAEVLGPDVELELLVRGGPEGANTTWRVVSDETRELRTLLHRATDGLADA